jgi:hypothetical protein
VNRSEKIPVSAHEVQEITAVGYVGFGIHPFKLAPEQISYGLMLRAVKCKIIINEGPDLPRKEYRSRKDIAIAYTAQVY